MQVLRAGVLRPVLAVVCTLAVAACSSSGASAPPATGTAPATTAAGAASSAASPVATIGPVESVAGVSLAPVSAGAPSTHAPASNGAAAECPAGDASGHVVYRLGGFEAWHFCGPASATVTLGSTTVHISGGSCTTPIAGMYSVAIGTELFGSPPPAIEPDDLIITIVSANGLTDPGGVVDHKGWLLVGKAIKFGPGKMSGTVSGTTINPGSAVKVSFTC